MGIKMKTISKSQRPLTYEDLYIGDIFRTYTKDNLYMKIQETYEDYDVKSKNETENYNAINLSTGSLSWVDDDIHVERYNKEIEITVDPNQDFISWI